jgi:hypothetical protein
MSYICGYEHVVVAQLIHIQSQLIGHDNSGGQLCSAGKACSAGRVFLTVSRTLKYESFMSSCVSAQDRLSYAFETYRTRREVCARGVGNPSAKAASVMMNIATNCDDII